LKKLILIYHQNLIMILFQNGQIINLFFIIKWQKGHQGQEKDHQEKDQNQGQGKDQGQGNQEKEILVLNFKEMTK